MKTNTWKLYGLKNRISTAFETLLNHVNRIFNATYWSEYSNSKMWPQVGGVELRFRGHVVFRITEGKLL